MLTVGLLSACNDGEDQTQTVPNTPSIPENKIVNPVVKTPSTYEKTILSEASQSLVLTYKMLGIQGQETQATALVFVPKTTMPKNGWPIVAWAHGTTGVADLCAPSKLPLDSATTSLFEKLLNAGYVVVAPDYEGLGEPSGREAHPYLNLKSEAYSLTDAVVAARDYLKNKTDTQWMAVGHSQGGHAALGAGEFERRAQLNYKGTIALAPASNLQKIFEFGIQSVAGKTALEQLPTYISLNTYAALITAGLQNPSNEKLYDQVFEMKSAAIAKTAETQCANSVTSSFIQEMQNEAMTLNRLDGYLYQNNFLELDEIKTFLQKTSQPLTVQQNAPIVIYQGSADKTVLPNMTYDLFHNAPKGKHSIRYVIENTGMPQWDHNTVFSENIDKIVEDVKTLMPIQ